jgi:signal transduction histidine kinase
VREEILLNERYGSLEIDKNGIILSCNNHARVILNDIFKKNFAGELKGSAVTVIAGSPESSDYGHTSPEKIISVIPGIRLIDTIFYKKTDTVVVRFVKLNEIFTPFFDLIKFSSSLYMELDDNLNIIYMTDSFLRIAGAVSSEIYGENISSITDRDGLAKINSASDLCRKEIIDSIKIDEIQFNFNGIIYFYDLEISPVRSSAGGIFCHLVDSSAEKKIKNMNRVIRRMSAVANFAGGIAHDYNNALTAVLGNISLAKMDAEKNSELEELLRDAESAGLKIKMLTERLGMFARGMKPAKDKTDIKKLIESIFPELFLNYKGRYKISIQDKMTQPEIDQELISEAVRHVIENAIDAADNTDGEIAIDAKETDVDQESIFREISLVPGRYIIISVADNGEGLDSHAAGDIFDPYVTTKNGREGLGLALAYTILKRHRGFISVDASESGGAVFKIYIPLF